MLIKCVTARDYNFAYDYDLISCPNHAKSFNTIWLWLLFSGRIELIAWAYGHLRTCRGWVVVGTFLSDKFTQIPDAWVLISGCKHKCSKFPRVIKLLQLQKIYSYIKFSPFCSFLCLKTVTRVPPVTRRKNATTMLTQPMVTRGALDPLDLE